MKSLLEINPNASQDALKLNPHLCPTKANKTIPSATGVGRKGRRGMMNQTEAEFAMILEAQKREGEIVRYEFEGMTLRWKCGEDEEGNPVILTYTPDFYVVVQTLQPGARDFSHVKLIEVKGGYTKGKFERAVERFRHSRTYFPELTFELWRKSKDFGWRREL